MGCAIPYVARPRRGSAIANDRFPKERFSYDPAADAYHCPGGNLLDTRYPSVTRGHVSIQYSNPAACAACAIRARCTGGRWRRINRWENEAVLERMAKQLAARPGVLDVRRETVEHPFGSIKQWMNRGAFLMRGLENVRAEFSLTALTYNLRRAITVIGVPGMIRAGGGLICAANCASAVTKMLPSSHSSGGAASNPDFSALRAASTKQNVRRNAPSEFSHMG